jgi:hypothetical protein
MHPREQGRRRVAAVTVGLAAASLAGTVAVGAAAWAKSGQDGEAATPAPDVTTSPGATQPPATTTSTPPPSSGGELTAPSGTITNEDPRPPHATSAGT